MRLLAVGLLLAVTGSCGVCDYHGEAREVRRLASGIDGLEILDVDGNHDLTLESLWLDAVYRGTPVYFTNVTPASFRDVDHLQVAQVGEWGFRLEEFEAGETVPFEYAKYDPRDRNIPVKHFSTGGSLDFGPEGDVGVDFDPPIRSIPEFLERLPEAVARIEKLPERPPGIRIATGMGIRLKTGTRERIEIPTWIWAWRNRASD